MTRCQSWARDFRVTEGARPSHANLFIILGERLTELEDEDSARRSPERRTRGRVSGWAASRTANSKFHSRLVGLPSGTDELLPLSE